jgi:multidrug resistance efflux pump
MFPAISRENKLERIQIGDAVLVDVMGSKVQLKGKVEGIAGGIEDRERTDSTSLLANVSPTFNWVRLAQRVPVRVKLEKCHKAFIWWPVAQSAFRS